MQKDLEAVVYAKEEEEEEERADARLLKHECKRRREIKNHCYIEKQNEGSCVI